MASVSVILAFRNRANIISRSLKSLELLNVDYELVAIDGHSTDNSLEVVRHVNPSILIQSEPKGVYDAWNQGIASCTTPYAIFLNSDDEILPDMERLILNAFKSASAITASLSVLSPTCSSQHSDLLLRWPRDLSARSLVRGAFPFNSAVFSVAAIREVGGFDTRFQFLADRYLAYQLGVLDSNPSTFYEFTSYRYHMSSDSLTLNGAYIPVAKDIALWSRNVGGLDKLALCLYKSLSRLRSRTSGVF
jgi:glycosyltransferase involved in cell wall biosynthesis